MKANSFAEAYFLSKILQRTSMSSMSISDLAAFVGMTTGISGFTLALATYLRERPAAKVELMWNTIYRADNYMDATRFLVKVSVSNTGRRPIYITKLELLLYKNSTKKNSSVVLGLDEHSESKHLAEGGKPLVVQQDQCIIQLQELLKNQPHAWRWIRAQATDSTGKQFRSKPCLKKPLWDPAQKQP